MHASSELPAPDAAARVHSDDVAALIHRRIVAAGGWIDFSDYMDLALYAPGFGYYSAGSTKFGAAGDFVTAPEISTLFARCVARAIEPVIRRGPGNQILEFGAGTGVLAAGVLQALDRAGAPPERYRILEVSADLRERQHGTLTERVPDLLPRVDWLDALPSAFDGVVLANEVADALPVSCFCTGSGAGADRIRARGVAVAGDGFRWAEGPASDALRERVAAIETSVGVSFPAGFSSEVSLNLPAFVGGIGQVLRDGVCLIVDYGLPRRELYASGREQGTLVCHYRHRAHADPFLYPGLQDITAWVDFTSVAEAADAAGLRVDGYVSQAQFLIAAGIEQEFLAAGSTGAGEAPRLQLSREMQALLMPGEMGEKFKVMCLLKGAARLAPEFDRHDQRHRL